MRPIVLVHGGAGGHEAARAGRQQTGLLRAVAEAWAILEAGGGALDAAVAAVCVLEDDPEFNAGRGSVLAADGTVEMDASVMRGTDLAAAAVGAVSGVRHAVRLAHAVLERTSHVLLVGPAARHAAGEWEVELCAPEALITEPQRQRLAERRRTSEGGTVGAVVLDRAGTVAAATSTGGLRGKRPGRVGDSAIIGAGTYADDRAGAVSATGDGEAIIKVGLAKRTADELRSGIAPALAAARALVELENRPRGEAGLIAVDALGRLGYAVTRHAAMTVAWRRGTGEAVAETARGIGGLKIED